MTPEQISEFERVMADGRERTSGELCRRIGCSPQILGRYVGLSGKYSVERYSSDGINATIYRLKSNVAA